MCGKTYCVSRLWTLPGRRLPCASSWVKICYIPS
ncbi:Protein artemis, partial [Araneus ventricosus]